MLTLTFIIFLKSIMESKKIIDKHGNIFWINDKGERHRLDGPALITTKGALKWYKNNKPHRLDGPAIKYKNGVEKWFKEGNLHREDGPAIVGGHNGNFWFNEGKLHRESGPAIEYKNGSKCWYLADVEYSEQEYKKKMRLKKINKLRK